MGAFLPAARAQFAQRLEMVYALFPRMRERRTQLAGTMSGGEQQMCAIGRALMCGPQLLLLDEPSAGLAPVVVQSIFEVIRRMGAEGYTVLIVEQNIQPGAESRRPRLPARDRPRPAKRRGRRPAGQRRGAQGLPGHMTMEIFDIFLLEAVLNGLLLGGLLALLSLGLNLIFGVIDVVWICYAELMMIGMYAIYWLHRSTACRCCWRWRSAWPSSRCWAPRCTSS